MTPPSDNKRIVLVNHSDIRGGASVVSMRLMRALCNAGYDARMLVMHKGTADPRVDTVAGKWRQRAAFAGEHVNILMRNGFSRETLFKLSANTAGIDICKHPWMRDAGTVIVNWVNQGMLSLNNIRAIAATGKKVIWTMHDMWNLTGVCHHAGTCRKYMTGCGHCPMIRGGKVERDLSSRTFARKQAVYAGTDIRFVAVSHWLAERCAESPLMRDADVTVIPNAFPIDRFRTSAAVTRADLNLPDGRLIVMGAARLDDPIKNLPLAVESLNRYHAAHPEDDTRAIFYGQIRDAHALDGLRMPHVALGTVPVDTVAQIYAHADVVLSTSLYETLPGTLVEGIAAGATAVTTGNGGQSDIVTHGETGYIDMTYTGEAIAGYLAKALGHPFGRDAQHAAMARRFSDDAVARRYIELINR